MANEKRLIDGDKLRGLKYEKVKFSDYKEGWNDAIDTILTEVFSPSVDAVEVVHASWIHASNKPGVWIGMKCSLCGARIRYTEFINGNHNYCHKCGAKMDGGNEDV